MFKDQVKESIKNIPGVLKAYSVFTGIPRKLTNDAPGDFLFREKTLSWLSRSDLRRQLPILYRMFALLCGFKIFNNDSINIKLRKAIFRIISYITHIFKLGDSAQIDLSAYKVCINILDPRCLKVVDELMHNADRLTNFLSEGDTFIDIGANHGSYSIIAAKIVGRRGFVMSVEPQPRLAELLNISLTLNGHSNFEIHQIACSDREGAADMFIPEYNSGEASIFSTLSATHKHQTIKVKLKPFDSAFEWQGFPGNVFVKLDIEGSEYAFLKGAREMIRTRKPYIMYEVNPASLKSAEISEASLKKLFQELGYSIFCYINNPSEIIGIESLDVTQERDIVLFPSGKRPQA